MNQLPEEAASAPFSYSFSPSIPELLLGLNCSIAITTYQAGKVVLIKPNPDKERLSMLLRNFEKPMGMAVDGDKIVLATKDEIILFETSPELAVHYPNKPNFYDNLIVPRVTFHTGQVDMHDIAFGRDGIWAINTSFSCLCKVNGHYNFIPTWKPSFITQLKSEDYCHLNGLAMKNGTPKFVTALGTQDTPQGWRENIIHGGVLMDVETGATLLSELPMPHSPVIHQGELYILLSATGEIAKVDPEKRSYEVISRLDGFCRGMAFYDDYLFVGMSRLRESSSTFLKLDFPDKSVRAGIKIIHLPTRALVGEIVFQTTIEEIYSVTILPGMINPNILNTMNPIYKYSLAIPDATFWADPANDAKNKTENIHLPKNDRI